MYCLWCDEEIISTVTWSNFLLLPSQKKICSNCADGLEIIGGSRCSVCSRSCEDATCPDCVKWESLFVGGDTLTKNYSIYSYNPAIQAIVTKWKYRGDYCLGELFQQTIRQTFAKEFGTLPSNSILVPIPLSQERMKERGFNQAKILSDFLPLKTRDVLTRIHGEKQSKKTRFERITAQNPFFLNETVKKTVILVDDIYTTGTTLRHAASLLLENGCPEVYALTLIRG
ncbi:phosphoribosyltransferase family protein [Virgibacillus sp. DJP39]|uniref:ComF family protein n=1 Tax=Virgibacillus sp. DJP39 TaxID=3409790 RepID=UPI003BB695F5